MLLLLSIVNAVTSLEILQAAIVRSDKGIPCVSILMIFLSTEVERFDKKKWQINATIW